MRKRTEMQKLYNLPKDEIEEVLSDSILEFLIKEWINEKGVRKLEQACHKIVGEYIYAKNANKNASKRSHTCLFVLLWTFLLLLCASPQVRHSKAVSEMEHMSEMTQKKVANFS